MTQLRDHQLRAKIGRSADTTRGARMLTARIGYAQQRRAIDAATATTSATPRDCPHRDYAACDCPRGCAN